MCQGYENEHKFMVRGELAEVKELWRRHETGEQSLSRDQLIELVARKMMLEER